MRPAFPMRTGLIAGLVALMGGCAHFPELDAATDPAVFKAPYPTLLPFDQLKPPPATAPTTDPAAALDAEGAALRRRADALAAAP